MPFLGPRCTCDLNDEKDGTKRFKYCGGLKRADKRYCLALRKTQLAALLPYNMQPSRYSGKRVAGTCVNGWNDVAELQFLATQMGLWADDIQARTAQFLASSAQLRRVRWLHSKGERQSVPKTCRAFDFE